MTAVIRAHAEQRYQDQLHRLKAADTALAPPGWALSPGAVRRFICGDTALDIPRKYYGEDALVERAIVSLMGNNGLMLVGEPGTAKSMLSELLSAAISGNSQYLIQGTAGTTEEQLKYSWNFALLLSGGPSLEALLKSPIYQAMEQGKLARIEEITRCPQEIQDVLISLMSEKSLSIPELGIAIQAKPGFNLIATANLLDRGVNDMSSALKRRFNFETVPVLKDPALERQLILSQVSQRLADEGQDLKLDEALVDLLVQVFHDLRNNMGSQAMEATLSTAEAVNIVHGCALHSLYWQQPMHAAQLVQQMHGTLIKDKADDVKKLAHYLDAVARDRPGWQDFFLAGKALWMR
ncbi:ATPase [Gallaecimonas xiamenensis 3-C-1]|uniref:ATPase n=2 Tax=Gallaecimonas TaxID=745410 RepID=K2IH72_9GAMM|nr:ATPase [Gallaecimonas xiamenensis 3-C-1]